MKIEGKMTLDIDMDINLQADGILPKDKLLSKIDIMPDMIWELLKSEMFQDVDDAIKTDIRISWVSKKITE